MLLLEDGVIKDIAKKQSGPFCVDNLEIVRVNIDKGRIGDVTKVPIDKVVVGIDKVIKDHARERTREWHS